MGVYTPKINYRYSKIYDFFVTFDVLFAVLRMRFPLGHIQARV